MEASNDFFQITGTERWDKEWLHYFQKEPMYPHITSYRRLEVAEDISSYDAERTFTARIVKDKAGESSGPLRVWIEGRELVGKDVLEIGSGCGWFGKRVGMIARRYLGIDASQFAVTIARGVSPSNCEYFHLSEKQEILQRAGLFDVMVGREFFIHQNMHNAISTLRLGSLMLKSGGLISADFYYGNPAVKQGVVHRAASPLDERYASCAFQYEDEDVHRLAREAGLTLERTEIYVPHQRKFVRFRKP